MQQAVALLLVLAAAVSAEAQSVNLTSWGSLWRYNDKGVQLPINWADATYSDAAWKEGRGPLGT